MLTRLFPFLDPEFTWPTSSRKPIATTIPPTPRRTPWIVRRFWGYVHHLLFRFSIRYCRWTGIRFCNQICPLPFGLVLKWSDGTRVEEALAMQVARAAGLPVPNVITYGEHPDMPHAPASILMTRMPGVELWADLWEWFDSEEKATIVSELKTYLDAMRRWPNPWKDKHPICSVEGTSIRSVRVPGHEIGPCMDEKEFNGILIAPGEGSHARSFPNWQEDMKKARKLHSESREIVFTHGDFQEHNILVTEDGHVSAILDWEAAGWYPDYWEYTTAWRLGKPRLWWYEIVTQLAEGKFLAEREGDLAVRRLTADSMAW